jgi:hypothetical protein
MLPQKVTSFLRYVTILVPDGPAVVWGSNVGRAGNLTR